MVCSYIHTNTDQPVNVPDLREDREFYVTVRDSERTGFLLGPFSSHQEALDNVETGKSLAFKADPWSHFYAFGTSSLPKGTNRKVVFA